MSQVELNEIVDVQISRDTLQLSRVGFGTALLVVSGFTDTTEEVVKEYSALSEVLGDGFDADSAAYKAAAAYFGQVLKPTKLLIGEYDSADPVGSIAAVDAVNSDWYALLLGDADGDVGETTRTDRILAVAEWIESQYRIMVVAAFGADTIDESVGDDDVSLTAQLKALGYDRTATIWNGESVEVEGDDLIVNGDFSDDSGDPWEVTSAQSSSFDDGVLTIEATSGGDLSFKQPIDVVDAGAYICRLDIVSSGDPGASMWVSLGGTAVYPIATEGSRVFIIPGVPSGDGFFNIFMVSDPGAEFVFDNISIARLIADTTSHGEAAAAWLGRMLPTDPGSATWAHKNLKGVLPARLNTTQRDNLFDKSGNLYSNISGTNTTRWGTVASGEYLDIIHGIDWLRQRITEAVFRLLATKGKVAYTDAGIASIENELRAQLRAAQSVGLIAPDAQGSPGFTIETPKALDVDIADRAARILPSMKFEARLAGAVHKVIVRGVVTP